MDSMPTEYDALFREAAEVRGLDWQMLKAQAWCESRLNPWAVSPAGAEGLCQFMPPTWAEWAPRAGLSGRSPFDPAAAIAVQAAYMAWLLARPVVAGHLERALAAYNWGIGNVALAFGRYGPNGWLVHAPLETQRYVRQVQDHYWAMVDDAPVERA